MISGNQDDRRVARCSNPSHEITKSAERGLWRCWTIENVAGDDERVRTMLNQCGFHLRQDSVVIIVKHRAVELTPEVPIAGMENSQTLYPSRIYSCKK